MVEIYQIIPCFLFFLRQFFILGNEFQEIQTEKNRLNDKIVIIIASY